jgi:hypothetical protein
LLDRTCIVPQRQPRFAKLAWQTKGLHTARPILSPSSYRVTA